MIMAYRLFHAFFYTLIALRFCYPFFNSPLDHMSGLSGRQWRQAGLFWNPPEMGGIDAFLYQPWLAMVRFISLDQPSILLACCGLLCAAMPLCWYACARQLMPKKYALAAGIIIAICPSFLTIYAYFASETLLLPLMGLACTFTAICYKTPRQQWLVMASILWIACAFTRMLAIPPAVICIGFLLWHVRWPLKSSLVIGVFLIVMTAAASWHSHRAIQVTAPFGLTHLNAAMARSQTMRVYYSIDQSRYKWFRSPSLSTRLFHPFSDWRISDQTAPIYLSIRSQDGIDSWDKALEPYPITPSLFIRQVSLNTLFVLFGPSWPESWPENWKLEGEYNPIEHEINLWWRWIWAPLIVLVCIGVWRNALPLLPQAFLTLTLALLLMLCFQFSGVLEGRYRKPIEPMLILSCLCMLSHRQPSIKKHHEPAY